MTYAITWIRPGVLTVVFREEVSLAVHDQVMQVTALFQGRYPGLIADTVPSYHQVTLFFTRSSADPDLEEWVHGEIRTTLNPASDGRDSREVTVPVCYGGDFGPDLAELAGYHQLSGDEVIRLHTAGVYTVYMLGFLPGFPYLGGLDPALSTPRRATPRKQVPAGSVGIAGGQTGVYPSSSPGGWQLIGRTPLTLVDVTKEDPCLFRPGDRIRFEPITESEFQRWHKGW